MADSDTTSDVTQQKMLIRSISSTSIYRVGVAHSIGDDTKYEGKHKDESIIPWLVFKKRN